MDKLKSMIFILIIFTSSAFAGEVEETRRLAEKYKAQAEVVLWDLTRVDLLNDEYAIEVEWPRKWAEAVGQSLYYAEVTKRKPAIILLVRDKRSESKYIYRLQTVTAKHGIKLYLEEIDDD